MSFSLFFLFSSFFGTLSLCFSPSFSFYLTFTLCLCRSLWLLFQIQTALNRTQITYTPKISLRSFEKKASIPLCFFFFSLSLSRSMKARTLDVSTKSTWINYNVFVNPVIWDTFLFVCLNLRLRRTWFPRRDLIQIVCAAGDVMFVSLFEINWTEFECRNRNYIDWAEEQNLLGNISNGQAQRKPNVKGEMVEFFFNPTFIRFFCCISEWIALRKTCLV